jgi:Ca2+-binding EF-hand superfamily protein
MYTLLLTFIAAMLAGTTALAQSAPAAIPNGGDQSNHNKPVSKLHERLKSADKDGDGALTRAEAEAGNMGRIIEHFDRLDGNKDGKVTPEELRALIRSRLST